jgi:hypothetical protein
MHIKVWRGNKYYCTISGGRGTVTVGQIGREEAEGNGRDLRSIRLLNVAVELPFGVMLSHPLLIRLYAYELQAGIRLSLERARIFGESS